MKKFDGMTDSYIFSLWKHGDTDAEVELIQRYKEYSRHLAIKLLDDFRGATTVELDELISDGLFCLYLTYSKFKGKGPLYPYWNKIAFHKMMDDIKYYSPSFQSKSGGLNNGIISSSGDSEVFVSLSANSEASFLRNELITILEKEELHIKQEDRHLFLLFVDGYSYKELAMLYHRKYSTIRKKIIAIQKKLKDILFNS